MGKEVLSVPEEYLQDVVGVIRRRCDGTEPKPVAELLGEWCDVMSAEQDYDEPDGRTQAEAWWDANEDAVMEEIATGERDERGRRA